MHVVHCETTYITSRNTLHIFSADPVLDGVARKTNDFVIFASFTAFSADVITSTVPQYRCRFGIIAHMSDEGQPIPTAPVSSGVNTSNADATHQHFQFIPAGMIPPSHVFNSIPYTFRPAGGNASDSIDINEIFSGKLRMRGCRFIKRCCSRTECAL